MAGAEPQDLEEAGIIPLLANGLAESTGVLLRVHVGGGEELLTGATVGREQVCAACLPRWGKLPAPKLGPVPPPSSACLLPQVETAPRIDMYGEGLFTLAVVALGGAGMQDLVWCVSNIPNFEFGMGLQVRQQM